MIMHQSASARGQPELASAQVPPALKASACEPLWEEPRPIRLNLAI